MPVTTHNIILLWLYTFGNLFAKLKDRNAAVDRTYQKCEQSVRQVLDKFKPKLGSIPRL